MRSVLETVLLLQFPLKVMLFARRLLLDITTNITAFHPIPPPVAREQLRHALAIYLTASRSAIVHAQHAPTRV
jgi:hypothetical protein